MRSLLNQRLAGLPGWVLLTQLFLGLGWLRAASEKLVDPEWWAGGTIARFIDERQNDTIGWYRPFVEHIILPNLTLFAVLVVGLQIFAGLSMLSGRLIGYALFAGFTMNFHFLATGAVNPSAFYILSQGALALYMAEKQSFAGEHTLLYLRLAQIWTATTAVMSLPYVRTLDPGKVVDDPAMMFLTIGGLGVLVCHQTLERLKPRSWTGPDRRVRVERHLERQRSR